MEIIFVDGMSRGGIFVKNNLKLRVAEQTQNRKLYVPNCYFTKGKVNFECVPVNKFIKYFIHGNL